MMIVAVTPAAAHKARGLCSRWLPEVTPGVFVGIVHPAGLQRMMSQMPTSPEVMVVRRDGKEVVCWSSSDGTEHVVH